MPASILNLKFKGNKSFVAFSNLGDSDSLTKTWKVCTKVASYLEQGQRLENLSWRLWHLQNLIVESDNAKSKREFKKLSKVMGDKLDKEKGRAIEELEAPDFKLNPAAEKLRQRAEEKERSRFEAAQHSGSGRPLKRMQFTFSVDQPANQLGEPSSQFRDTILRRTRPATRASAHAQGADDAAPPEGNDKDPPSLTHFGRKPSPPPTPADDDAAAVHTASGLSAYGQSWNDNGSTLRFPTLFTNDFGPAALLFPQPSLANPLSYGEDTSSRAIANERFQILRPTIELPLDEILKDVSRSDSPDGWSSGDSSISSGAGAGAYTQDDVEMRNATAENGLRLPPMSRSAREVLPMTIHPAQVSPLPLPLPTSATPPARPTKPALTVKTDRAGSRANGPSATASAINSSALLSGVSSTAPGGVKAECSNCGATHTPLWRRGLNDELNCNACGLYCKLHKRPRPKSMRNQHGEGRHQAAPRNDSADSMGEPAQCYNCHTMATPLWRKDDEGKTVCNAFKLHGSARPISMKSDIIRKRSRHDARRVSGETPSASPGASRRASPSAAQQMSPTLAPDSSTVQPAYNYSQEDYDFAGPQSELMGALGGDPHSNGVFSTSGHFDNSFVYNPHAFPGPYNPELLQRSAYYGDSADAAGAEEDRLSKRRRMSIDSASEPPSSTASYSSYATETSSATTASRSSFDMGAAYAYPPFSAGGAHGGGGGGGGGGNGTGTLRAGAFWHPPMLPQTADKSPAAFVHPPMLPASEEFPMDFLHPPMQVPGEERDLFASYLHPPMVAGEDSPMAPMSALHPHPPMLPSETFFKHPQAQAHQQQQQQAQQQQQHKQEQAHAHAGYYEQNFGLVGGYNNRGFNAWAKEF
ncbi:hypothetical protein DFH11DRAFT_1840926 [Phellopilus nigrolimitatus]|nr:hypothetical protein DFH11DRAFT_1840926 [Phellopilus nigrolimitatus]